MAFMRSRGPDVSLMPDNNPVPAGGNEAIASAQRMITRLRESQLHLGRYLNRKHFPESMRYDPVRIKNLEKVAGGLQQLLPMLINLRAEASVQDSDFQSLGTLLDRLGKPEKLSGHNAWELADLMVIELLHRGDDVYLYSLLQSSDHADDSHRWSFHFPLADLDRLRKAYTDGRFTSDASRRETRRFLEQLQQFRIDEYRHDRAKAELRGVYLGRMVIALLVVVSIFATVYVWNEEPFSLKPGALTPGAVAILLVTSAGAMGSILSRAIKLGRGSLDVDRGPERSDHPLGIRALIAAWKLFLAQIGIGAAAGLIIYVVMESGVVAGLKTTDAARVSLLAFLAGFSEPFFIGILDRVAGSNSKL
jgi:hypothetical protein